MESYLRRKLAIVSSVSDSFRKNAAVVFPQNVSQKMNFRTEKPRILLQAKSVQKRGVLGGAYTRSEFPWIFDASCTKWVKPSYTKGRM